MFLNLKSFYTSSLRNQYFSAFIVNLVALCHGATVGWLSPALLTLTSSDSPLESGPITVDQMSWIGANLCFGGVAGTFLIGSVSKKFGSKPSLMLIALPNIVYWILIIFGKHYHYLYTARVVAGLTGGPLVRVIPQFISEIAEKDIRGKLGSLTSLIYNIGTCFAFIIGDQLNYFTIPYVMIIFPMIYLIAVFCFIHETPQFLIKQKEFEKAWKSLVFYRNVDLNSKGAEERSAKLLDEFIAMKKFEESYKEQSGPSLKSFFTKDSGRAFGLSFFLICLLQFSGSFTILQYTATIFQESGTKFDANASAIIVAVAQIVGNYTSLVLVERVGRKVLMLLSTFGMALGLSTVGIFSVFDKSGYDLTGFSWIPIISMSFAIYLASIGIVALPFIIMTEILPAQIKSTALTVCAASSPAICFFVLKAFPLLMVQIYLHGIMWLFAFACIVGLLIIAIYLPETKGKDLYKV